MTVTTEAATIWANGADAKNRQLFWHWMRAFLTEPAFEPV
jgi:hypothetical protein